MTGLFIGGAVLVVIIAIIAAATSPGNGDRSARDDARAAETARLRAINDRETAAAEAEERRKGFHCLSGWDGNHEGLEALIRAVLNDPGSMETISTRITPVNENGRHLVALDFTAKNAYGGRVRNTAYGYVDNGTCAATLEGID